MGRLNTANGANALLANQTGDENTATGFIALSRNTTGAGNTATGVRALATNTTGEANTANGGDALVDNTTGVANTATGFAAAEGNTTGNSNTATGEVALLQNTTGNNNTATGAGALSQNTTGNDNTADGFDALGNITGDNNIALGHFAGARLTTGSNNIDIGNEGLFGESNTIRIGTKGTHATTFVAGIHGVTIAGGSEVRVDSNGQLGTRTSSERFKREIKPMNNASETIFALKPVNFQYKRELDPQGIPQFGLVAEQVEKINPDLVARDDQGKPYTVRYEAVNAMLLNEFLKEHSTVQELKATVAQQQKQIETFATAFSEQATQIKKVSDQLQLSRSMPPQIAAANQ